MKGSIRTSRTRIWTYERSDLVWMSTFDDIEIHFLYYFLHFLFYNMMCNQIAQNYTSCTPQVPLWQTSNQKNRGNKSK